MAESTIKRQTKSSATVLASLPRFVHVLLSTVGFAGLITGWANSHPLLQTACVLGIAYSMFCWTSCLHEASHHTLCGSKKISIWIGRFAGTLSFNSYSVYRESHIRHHAYLNKPADWELWPYSDPEEPLWFRRLFCWLEIPFGFVTNPTVYGRLYFHKNSPITNLDVRKTIRNEYIAMAMFWAACVGLVAWTARWELFLMAWVIPQIVAGVFSTVRKFTEHLGMQSYDPLLGTRTVIGKNVFTRFCTYINFDGFIHGPHHRHPRFRHEQLSERMDTYQQENSQKTYPVFGTYVSAMRHMLPSILFSPGVGMNVGAPAPTAEKQHDISDFGTDVTTEILAASDTAEEHRSTSG